MALPFFNHLKQKLPNVLWLQLLTAPRLEKVEFNDTYTNVSELNELIPLVQHKRILNKVTHLTWCNEFMNWVTELELNRLLDNVQISFPQMVVIRR
jgi:hypothetical protein